MAFNPINFLNVPIVNPSGIQNFAQNLLSGYQAARAPVQMAQEEEARQLANQLSKANLQYLPQEQALNLQLLKAKLSDVGLQSDARRQELERMKAFRDLISGQSQQMQPTSSYEEQTQSPFINREQRMVQQQPSREQNVSVIQEGNPNLYNLDELYKQNPQFRSEFKRLGFTESTNVKSDPSSGQVFLERKLPSGRIELQAMQAGRKPEEIERAKAIAKADVKQYENANESISNLDSTQDNLDYLIKTLETNPNVKNVVGPINSVLTKYVGSSGDQLLASGLQAITGNATLASVNQLKGASSDKDISFIRSITATPKDQYAEFVGKTKALSMVNKLMTKRMHLISEYINEGYSSHEAMKRARRETNLEDIKPELESIAFGNQVANKIKDKSSIPVFSNQEEARQFLSNLSKEERTRMMQIMGII